jgi:hypothetical protein
MAPNSSVKGEPQRLATVGVATFARPLGPPYLER